MQLTGNVVQLELLHQTHAEALANAGSEQRETYGWAPVPGDLASAQGYIAAREQLMAAGTWISFAIRRLADDTVVGSTSFLNIERWDWPLATGNPDSVEIGSTWLAGSAQRSAVNTEAKFLMMRHAFEVWNVRRLQIKTDARNERSREAIARLGATFEGVLRSYQAAQGDVGLGGVRDTAMYSVVAAEWVDVRAGLERQLNR